MYTSNMIDANEASRCFGDDFGEQSEIGDASMTVEQNQFVFSIGVQK